jgi:hypothetical protein
MKFLVQKKGNVLIPMFNSDAEALKITKLKEGEVLEVDIVKKRNYEFHKKYFALVNLCFDNQETFETLDEMRFYLTIKSGFFKKIETGKGQMFMPKSISFAEMDETEFQDLYSKTLDCVCKFLNTTNENLLSELINYM